MRRRAYRGDAEQSQGKGVIGAGMGCSIVDSTPDCTRPRRDEFDSRSSAPTEGQFTKRTAMRKATCNVGK